MAETDKERGSGGRGRHTSVTADQNFSKSMTHCQGAQEAADATVPEIASVEDVGAFPPPLGLAIDMSENIFIINDAAVESGSVRRPRRPCSVWGNDAGDLHVLWTWSVEMELNRQLRYHIAVQWEVHLAAEWLLECCP